MSPWSALLLAALALVTPMAVGEDSGPFAPRAAVAFDTGPSGAVVAWVPGETPADSYRVYGLVSSEALTLLLDTATTKTPGAVATVPGGFAAYAVAGVRAGVESPLVVAVGSVPPGGDDCIVMVAPPPDPHVVVCDGRALPIKVYARPTW